MNAQGQLRETFTRGVGLAGDPAVAGLVAVTHHAGSWTNGTFYIHHNHCGDIVLTRSGTTTVGRYDYSVPRSRDNLQSQIGPDVCRFKFSSKELDRSTGFYYYGYRFYAPQWQRWISRDPIYERGPKRLAHDDGLASWDQGKNVYGFVLNNPINAVDPHGLIYSSWKTWLGVVCALLGAVFAKSGAGPVAVACVLLGGVFICWAIHDDAELLEKIKKGCGLCGPDSDGDGPPDGLDPYPNDPTDEVAETPPPRRNP